MTKARSAGALLGLTVALVGLVTAGVAAAWIAGSLGISTAAASQIVTAIQVGGWALVVVGFIFGAGLIGAVIATVRWYLVKKTRGLAIA